VAIVRYDSPLCDMIQLSRFSYILWDISSVMHKQIMVGVSVMIALTAIGTIEQAVQFQLQKSNSGGGGRVIAAPPAITGDNVYVE
jgi:hypothetical protein